MFLKVAVVSREILESVNSVNCISECQTYSIELDVYFVSRVEDIRSMVLFHSIVIIAEQLDFSLVLFNLLSNKKDNSGHRSYYSSNRRLLRKIYKIRYLR